VTALAVSSDRTFIAAGHATGSIHLWNLAKPAQAARTVAPTTLATIQAGKAEGHLKGARIRHLAFVGARHTAIVSSDDRGLAFYHSLGQVLGLANNDTVRIIGKYPDGEEAPPLPLPDPSPDRSLADNTLLGEAPLPDPSKASKTTANVFCLATLPLAVSAHQTDNFGLVALITSNKLLIAGLKPSPKTWWRAIQKDALHQSAASKGPIIGSLAWFPALAADDDPLLAFSWGSVVRIVAVGTAAAQPAQTAENGRSAATLMSGKKQEAKRTLAVQDRHLWTIDEKAVKLSWLTQKVSVTAHLRIG
jgi:hypothetical protein